MSEIQDAERHRQLLGELRERRATVERELVRELGPSPQEGAVTPSELSAALPEGSVLVDFFVHHRYVPAERDGAGALVAKGSWTEPRLSAWIVRPGAGELVMLDREHVDAEDARLQRRVVRARLAVDAGEQHGGLGGERADRGRGQADARISDCGRDDGDRGREQPHALLEGVGVDAGDLRQLVQREILEERHSLDP